MGTPRGLCFSPLHSKNPGLPPLPPVEQLARLCCSFQATLGSSAPGGSPSPQRSVLLCASKLLSRVPPPRCACLLWTWRLLRVGAMSYLGQLSPLEPRMLLTAPCAAFHSPTAQGASQFGTCDRQCVRSGGRDGLSHGWN